MPDFTNALTDETFTDWYELIDPTAPMSLGMYETPFAASRAAAGLERYEIWRDGKFVAGGRNIPAGAIPPHFPGRPGGSAYEPDPYAPPGLGDGSLAVYGAASLAIAMIATGIALYWVLA